MATIKYKLIYDLKTNCVKELDNEYCFDFEKAEIIKDKKELQKQLSEVKQLKEELKKEIKEINEEKAINNIAETAEIINKVAEQEQFSQDEAINEDSEINEIKSAIELLEELSLSQKGKDKKETLEAIDLLKDLL